LLRLAVQQRKLLFILPSFPSAVQPESSRALSSHAGRGPVRADPTCVHGSNCSRQQRGRHLPSPKIAHTLQPHGGIRCTCTVPAASRICRICRIVLYYPVGHGAILRTLWPSSRSRNYFKFIQSSWG